jgi:alpha-1,2-mannosyltransferase
MSWSGLIGGAPRPTRGRKWSALGWASVGALVGALAVGEIAAIAGHHGLGSDFAGTFYHPAEAVAHGRSPYADPRVAGPLAGSVYPPSAFVPIVWIGLLPRSVAVAIWIGSLAIAAAGTLWILGIRDARLYALWLFTPMMLTTTAIGNGTVLVVFLSAVLWRWRDSPRTAAVALSGAIAIKLFVAPMIVWLLITKRYRAAALTLLATPVLVICSWAVIGFSALGRYPSILTANRAVFGRDGPFVQQLVLQLGGRSVIALVAGIIAGTALLVGAVYVGDVGGFALAAAASVVLAPVAWIGYLGLLVSPLAALWPRVSAAWLVLLVGTYAHWYYTPLAYKSVGLSLYTLGVFAAVLGMILSADRRVDRISLLHPHPAAANLAQGSS